MPRPGRWLPGRRLNVAVRTVWVLSASLALGCARPPKRPMEHMGPWAVGYRRATGVDHRRGGRTLPMAIWYPVEPEKAQGKRASYTCFESALLTLGVRSDVAVRDAPISRARRWPLVVFSHASPSLETQSPNYVETLASQGFVVVGVRHVGNTVFESFRDGQALESITRTVMARGTDGEAVAREERFSAYEIAAAARHGEAWALELVGNPRHFNLVRPFDVWFTIDWMAEQAGRPASFLHGLVNTDRVGVTGHSGGASTALAAAMGYGGLPPDPRIRAVVPIATAGAALIPDEALRTITAPVLFVTGDNDERAPWRGETLRASQLVSSSCATIARIRGAGHAHFADIDGFAHRVKSLGLYPWTWRWIGIGRLLRTYREVHAPGMLSPYEAQRILNEHAVAFLARHLKGEHPSQAARPTARHRCGRPAIITSGTTSP